MATDTLTKEKTSSAITYTKNEWTINNWSQGNSEIRIGAIGTPRIATVHFCDASINEQKANARLIAAAPELLAVCKQAAQWCRYNGCGIGLTAEMPWLEDMIASITKATMTE